MQSSGLRSIEAFGLDDRTAERRTRGGVLRRAIVRRVGVYKGQITEHHTRYDEIVTGWRDGKYPAVDRNLMIDGLMKRFITQVDEAA